MGYICAEPEKPKKSNIIRKNGGHTLGKSNNPKTKIGEMIIEEQEFQLQYNTVAKGAKTNHINAIKEGEIEKPMNNQTRTMDRKNSLYNSKKTEVIMEEETKIKNCKNLPNISLIGQSANPQNKKFNEIEVENSYIQAPYNSTIKDSNNNILDSSKNVYTEQNLDNKKKIEKFKKIKNGENISGLGINNSISAQSKNKIIGKSFNPYSKRINETVVENSNIKLPNKTIVKGFNNNIIINETRNKIIENSLECQPKEIEENNKTKLEVNNTGTQIKNNIINESDNKPMEPLFDAKIKFKEIADEMEIGNDNADKSYKTVLLKNNKKIKKIIITKIN